LRDGQRGHGNTITIGDNENPASAGSVFYQWPWPCARGAGRHLRWLDASHIAGPSIGHIVFRRIP
jgi:hypothetical protein